MEETKAGATDLFLPIATLCQSSGHGKTKFMKQFSEANLSIFICLRAQNDKGCPDGSVISRDFLNAMRNVQPSLKFLFSLILAALELIEKIQKSHKDNEVTREFMLYQPWKMKNYYLNNDSSLETKQNEFRENVLQEYSEYSENNEDFDSGSINESIKTKMNEIMKDMVLFVLIDIIIRAKALLEPSDFPDFDRNNESLLKVFRRSIHDLFKGVRIVFLLTDTNSKISNFTSVKETTDGNKIVLPNTYEPFYKIFNVDLFLPFYYKKRIESKKKFNFNDLLKRNPFDTLFYYGRPLWGSLISCKYKLILEMAKEKLIFYTEWTQLNSSEKVHAKLAALSSRTTLMLTYSANVNSNLVAKYMSKLYHVNDDLSELHARYISEPILAAAASMIMSESEHLKSILDNLNNYVQSVSLNSTGSIGEIVAELILLLAYDRACGNILDMTLKNLLKAITVESFLKSLVGESNYDIMKKDIPKNIEKGLLCFTHFIKKYDKLNVEDAIKDFIGRGAAGQFKNNEKGIDLFIPVVSGNDIITYIFIQVKNYADKISPKAINVVIEKMKPEISYFEESIKPYLSIFMNLGTEYDDQIKTYSVEQSIGSAQKQINHFMFAYPFLEKLSVETSFRMLLDTDKATDFSLLSKRVCQSVFSGSMNFVMGKNNTKFAKD